MELVKDSKLSPKETMELITSIAIIEFDTPRLQRDNETRARTFNAFLNLILLKYFSPRQALTIISDLAVKLVTEHPEILPDDEPPSYIG